MSDISIKPEIRIKHFSLILIGLGELFEKLLRLKPTEGQEKMISDISSLNLSFLFNPFFKFIYLIGTFC